MKKPIFFAVVLLIAAGCKKKELQQSVTGIFPNEIGDSWTYLVNDTSYFLQGPPAVSRYNMTLSITGTVQLPGGTTANVWIYNSPAGTDTNYVFRSGDSVIFTGNKNYASLFNRKYVVPLRLNQSWDYSWMSAHPVSITSQANVVVGQNHFDNAYHITGYPGRPDEIIELDEWVKDHVGVVKRYVDASGTTNPYKHRTSWELLSYNLH